MNATVVLLLAFAAPSFAQPNSPSGPVDVHVAESRIGDDCAAANNGYACKSAQFLSVLISGKKYELEATTFFPKGIVALGDYKASLVEDEEKPTHEFTRRYQLIFPDGSKRNFKVVGVLEQ